jgi:hypothetical protein
MRKLKIGFFLIYACFAADAAEPVFIRIKDVAAKRYLAISNGRTVDGIKTKWRVEKVNGASVYKLTLENTCSRDRILLVSGAVPVTAKNAVWCADPRRSEKIRKNKSYHSYAGRGTTCGLRGNSSSYPLGAIVCSKNKGIGIGLNPGYPAMFRIEYDGTRELFSINFDIGLPVEKNKAEISFCVFDFDPAWKFRGALERYYKIFPDAYTDRAKEHGTWMPFNPIQKVQGWRDFGFKFREAHYGFDWDAKNGIYSFRYWEPSSWWMKVPPQVLRTRKAVFEQLKKESGQGNKRAESVLTSGVFDAKGRPVVFITKESWCDGAVWNICSLPGIKGKVTGTNLGINAEKLADYDRPGNPLAGEVLDSQEGFMSVPRNYRREHFAAAETPATYAMESGRIVIHKSMPLYEYARKVANEMHKRSKLVMGNNVPVTWCWNNPNFDVMGTEVDWLKGGWRPTSDKSCLYSRSMARYKPFIFLQNTNFKKFDDKMFEKYVKRSAAYGIFPGFFVCKGHHKRFWTMPELYNRVRNLSKTYIPVIRQLSEAGWEPVTRARADDKAIYVERFGSNFFTVFNSGKKIKNFTLTLDDKSINKLENLISKKILEVRKGKVSIKLHPEDVLILSTIIK